MPQSPVSIIPNQIQKVRIEKMVRMHYPQDKNENDKLTSVEKAALALLCAIETNDIATAVALLASPRVDGMVEIFLMNKRTNIKTPFHVDCPVPLAEIILLRFLQVYSHDPASIVNCRDKWDDTPLHSAAAHGEYEHVRLFLHHGAEMNLRNVEKQTPLMAAVAECFNEEKRNATVELFFQERGNEISSHHLTEALEQAILVGHYSTLQLLLDRWKDFNQNSFCISDSLVHFAYETVGEVLGPTLGVLLKFGANIHAKDSQGKTMLQKAVERSDLSDTQCLLRYGATH